MRPDEEANRAEIERHQKTKSNIATGAGALAGVGLGAAASRIIPFLSEYIPTNLAMKGISKLSPQLGNFLKRGQSMGLNVEEGINYIRDSFKSDEENKSKPAKENRNIIDQYAPELNQFMTQEIAKGRSPIEAAAIAQHDKRFSDVIKKMIKDHKTPWSSIVESIFGSGQRGGAMKPTNQQQSLAQEVLQPPGSLPTRPPSAEAQALNNQQGGQQQGNDKWNQIASSLQNLLNS